MSDTSWKNNNLLNLKEDKERNYELYKNMAYGALEDIIMNSPYIDSVCDIIAKTASYDADKRNLDFIEDEFDDLIMERFKYDINRVLEVMPVRVDEVVHPNWR